jgi:3-oxoacyl-ACP reductase-like protein
LHPEEYFYQVSKIEIFSWKTFRKMIFFLSKGNEKRTGETAVITGGSRGIGAAVVRKLLQCDMHVIIGTFKKFMKIFYNL